MNASAHRALGDANGAGVGTLLGARSPGLPFGLALTASNRELCLERTAVRDAQGRVASWAQRSWRERPGFSKRASRADAVLGGYSALRFDRATKERVSQTDCVLPVGEEALPFMRRRFADRQHADAMSGWGMIASAEFTGSFTCYWDEGANTLDCGGVQCSAGSSLRAVSSEGAKVRRGAMVNADGGSFSGVYTCDNSCTITALLDGSGGWDCGTDAWGSGGNGGGGNSGNGGGGNGSGTPTATNLCQQPQGNLPVDSLLNCNRDRTTSEDAAIAHARANHLRTSFGGDSVAASECAQMNLWLTEALASTYTDGSGMVKQTFSTGIDNSGPEPHNGSGNIGGLIGHVDPGVYTDIANSPSAANYRLLMSVLLHEVAHAWGGNSHPSFVNGTSVAYTDPWFKRLNPGSLDAQTCLR